MHSNRPAAARQKALAAIAASALCGLAHAQLVGIDYDTGKIYNISTADASVTLRSTSTLLGASDLAYGPDGKHYAFGSGANAELFTINIDTGVKTSVGGMGLSFAFEGALTFSPGGVAYGTNVGEAENPSFFTVNTNTGVATVVDTIGALPHDVNGMVWRADGKLVGIDREPNALVEFSPTTGALSTIITYGAGAPAIGEVGGMCMYNGNAYFATAAEDSALPGDNKLYKVNLTTGAPTLVGTLTGITGTGLSGLTIVPEPGTLAVFVSAALWLACNRKNRRQES